jgi:hypothetical protein
VVDVGGDLSCRSHEDAGHHQDQQYGEADGEHREDQPGAFHGEVLDRDYQCLAAF